MSQAPSLHVHVHVDTLRSKLISSLSMQYSKIATNVEIRCYSTSCVYTSTTTIIYHVTSTDLEAV